MKYSNYIKNLLNALIVIYIIFLFIKHNSCFGEIIPNTISHDSLLKTKQILYNALRELVYSKPFIDKYGKSNINPTFLTSYYLIVICKPEFIIDFIEGLPLNDIINNAENSTSFIKQIETLFLIYVDTSQKEFENRIKVLLSLALNIKIFSFIGDLSKIKGFLFELKTYDDIDIYTASARFQQLLLKKKVSTTIAVFLGFCYVGIYLLRG